MPGRRAFRCHLAMIVLPQWCSVLHGIGIGIGDQDVWKMFYEQYDIEGIHFFYLVGLTQFLCFLRFVPIFSDLPLML